MGARRGGGEPRKSGARRVGARRGGPRVGAEGWGAQNFALFLLSPTGNFILSSLSGGFLVEFWWCLKRRDAQMCAFGVLWLSCEAPAARSGGAARASHDDQRAQTCTFERPGASNTTKIPREDPQREKKERNFRRERKKRANFGRSRGRSVSGGGSGGESQKS